jgi:hypothetical protein
MADEVIYNVKGLIRDLNTLEPGLKNAMVKEAKAEAKPIVANIKRAIPDVAPLSGMSKVTKSGGTNNGRIAWGSGKPANQVSVRFRAGRSRSRAITPLVAIWVTSPMTAIADIAGKGSMRKARRVTSEYAYKDGTRKHRVTTQGRIMVQKLRERNANDFIYPAVGDSIDDAEQRIKLVIEKYAQMVNRRIG